MVTKNQLQEKSSPTTAMPKITSESLFGKSRELVIQHAGQDYRLRITRQNKLILTK